VTATIEKIRERLTEFDAIPTFNDGARVWSKDPEFMGNAVGYIRTLLSELDAALEEIAERKRMGGVIGRKMRDLGAENWKLRDSLCRARWAHGERRRRHVYDIEMSWALRGVVSKDVPTIERQHQAIERLVVLLNKCLE